MLGFKDSQNSQLLDYYNETDLDNVDDQPVDYSKKYADQDSEESCVSRNKRHLSTTESIDNSKTPYDELKVYCIEGTPLIISSASSMSDLREIGTSQASENFKLLEEKEPSFQALTEISAIKENEKIEQKSEVCELNNTCGKISDENSHRNEEHFSKASSPLMFSRSSSVGSLNSFEMQSIVDDRSSVSVFSTLTSGLISPSDIPDSPGEAMSPFIHKNKFSFPSSNNEKSMDPILDNFKNNSTEQFENVFDDIPEDNVKVYDDEGDFSSVSNFSALTHHTTHTSSSRMSFTAFHTETVSNLNHVSSVKTKYSMKISEQSADKSGGNNEVNPLNHESPLSDLSCEVQIEMVKEVEGSSPGLNVSIEDNEPKNSEEYLKENSDDEALLDECIKSGMPCSSPAGKLSKETQSESTQVKKSFSEGEPAYSDDESDDLLDQCILLGKPRSKNTSMDLSKSPNVSPVHCTINSRVQENSPVQNCIPAYCEPDASDDENDLLADCIQLGRPQSIKSMTNLNGDINPKVLSSTCNRTPQFPVNKTLKSGPSNQLYPSQSDKTIQNKCPQTYTKRFNENDVSDDDLLEDCIQLGRPQSVKSNYTNSPDLKSKLSPTSTRSSVSQSPQVKLMKSNVSYHQTYPHHCNKPAQNFKKLRANPTVVQSLPPGYPKNTLKQSDNKEAYRSSTSRSFSPLGYRDNIPDGTSDVEEEDDDLVAECIRAGKQSVKTPEVNQSQPLKILPSKPVPQKKLSPKDDRASLQRKPNSLSQRRLFDSEYLRAGCISPSSMIDIDSMCVYRTEDTPLLSPTASISDLSTLSFSEDKIGHGYYLNNSRNSCCSSESEDDELLLQCIRSGMPGNKRAVA